MKKLSILFVTAIAVVPTLAFAQNGLFGLVRTAQDLINAVIPVIIGLALLAFLWGVLTYIFKTDADSKKDATKYMLWGLIALFVMVAVWGLIRVISVGLLGTNESQFGPIPAPSVPGVQIPNN